MRNLYQEQLHRLNQELIQMGAACEEIIDLAAQSLTAYSDKLEEKTNQVGAVIDESERTIETICLKLLLRQQPVASDLRQISAAMKMITDMERIGDQAEDIAEIIGFLQGRSGEECAFVGHMARSAISMVTGSVDAYVRRDTALAREIIARDDVVDEDFRKVKAELIDWIARRPDDGEYALDLLMIAKYFERIGDHATNIAEWVVFAVTGVHNGEELT